FRLAGKARDESRTNGDAWNALSHSAYKSFQALSRSASLHQPEHVSRSMLQRHIKILDSPFFRRQHIEKSIRNVCRVGIHHAHPFDAVQMRQLAQEMRE